MIISKPTRDDSRKGAAPERSQGRFRVRGQETEPSATVEAAGSAIRTNMSKHLSRARLTRSVTNYLSAMIGVIGLIFACAYHLASARF